MNIIVLNLDSKTDLEVAQAMRDTAKKLTDNAADFAGATPTPLQLTDGAKAAFVSGMHRGVLVAAVSAGIGAIVAWRYLPARATDAP